MYSGTAGIAVDACVTMARDVALAEGTKAAIEAEGGTVALHECDVTDRASTTIAIFVVPRSGAVQSARGRDMANAIQYAIFFHDAVGYS